MIHLISRCQLCPKAFATKESLDAHMERAHDDESSPLPENSASASNICTRRSSRQAEKQVDQSINMIKIIRRDPLEGEDPSILQGISASELRKMASFIDETAKKCLKCRKRFVCLLYHGKNISHKINQREKITLCYSMFTMQYGAEFTIFSS